METRKRAGVTGVLAAALLVGGSAPIVAPAVFAEVPSVQQTANIVDIKNADELANAIANQQDGQTWNLANGEYNLDAELLAKYAHLKIQDQGGFYLPIIANNITINGNGATITSDVVSANGAWATQNFITVAANNVTIDGVNIKCKKEVNKAIEVLGDGFSLSNATLLPVDDSNSGSIYFAGNAKNGTLTNVELSSWIRSSEMEGLVVDGVTVDFSKVAQQSDSAFVPVRKGENIEVKGKGLTVKVGSNINSLEDQVVEHLPAGTTLSLQGDIELDSTLDIRGKKNLVIDANGHAITTSDAFTKDEYGRIDLIKVFECDGVTIRNAKLSVGAVDDSYTGSQHVLDIHTSNNVTVENVSADHSKSIHKGAPLVVNGSSVALSGDVELSTGDKSWYAANVDSNGTLASLTSDNANLVLKGDKAVIVAEQGGTVSVPGFEDLGNGVIGKPAAKIGEQGYLTLADAVSAAKDGDTIVLSSGEHSGNLILDKDLMIVGAEDGSSVIKFNPEGRQVQQYLGDRAAYPTIYSTGDLVLRNLTVSGPTNQHHGIDGVFVKGGNLTLDGVTISDIRCTADGADYCGVQYGRAVLFEGSGDLTVTNSKLVAFQKQAIDVSTSGKVNISNNTITGAGQQGIIAQNGIVLRSGEALIEKNTISGLAYTGDNDWKGCSVAVYVTGDADTTLKGNIIDASNDWSITVEENATLVADHNQILAPVANYTDDVINLDGNYWGENPDFDQLIPEIEDGGKVEWENRYLDADMETLVDENGNEIIDWTPLEPSKPVDPEGNGDEVIDWTPLQPSKPADKKDDKAPSKDALPSTGDASLIGVAAATVMGVSALGAGVIGRKRR